MFNRLYARIRYVFNVLVNLIHWSLVLVNHDILTCDGTNPEFVNKRETTSISKQTEPRLTRTKYS